MTSFPFTEFALKEEKVKVAQSYPTLCDLMDCSVHGILQTRLMEWVAFPFSRGSSQPWNRTQISCIAGKVFTSWATKEAQEYWSGSLSFLQQIFPTQESNQGLLPCMWLLYQLSFQGSPWTCLEASLCQLPFSWSQVQRLSAVKHLEIICCNRDARLAYFPLVFGVFSRRKLLARETELAPPNPSERRICPPL